VKPDDMLLEQRLAISILTVERDRLEARNDKLEKAIKAIREELYADDSFMELWPLTAQALADLEQP